MVALLERQAALMAGHQQAHIRQVAALENQRSQVQADRVYMADLGKGSLRLRTQVNLRLQIAGGEEAVRFRLLVIRQAAMAEPDS